MNKRKAKLIRKLVYKNATEEDKVPTYKQLHTNQIINTNLFDSVYKDTKKATRNMSSKEIRDYLTRKVTLPKGD